MTNASLLGRLKRVECPDATYPAQDPVLVMDRASGSFVADAAGRTYIDLCAGFGVMALGHNAGPWREVLQAQLASAEAAGAPYPPLVHGMGDVYASRAKVELLDYLVRILPDHLSTASLALTGGQAVEIAVKTAILATKKVGFIAFEGGYHGLDLGILPLTARADFRTPFLGFVPETNVETVPFLASLSQLEDAIAALRLRVGGVAAMIVEPVQGRAGVRKAPVAWLETLRSVCDRHGILLIFDEIFTGLGRTGRLTIADTVRCDLLCLGKALGGGLPLSACVGTHAAMGAWPASSGEAIHTGTFFGHPLSCAVALRTLQTLIDGDWPRRAAATGAAALELLKDHVAVHPAVRDIRGEGLMLAVEFVQPGAGARAMDLLRQEGVIALASGASGESLSITPALTIPQELLSEALHRLVGILDKLPS